MARTNTVNKTANIADWKTSPIYTIVLITGGFDPVHSGHISLMKEALEYGDELWVGVNSDNWLTRKKGKPFMSLHERLIVMSSIKYVTKALDLFDKDDTANNLIQFVLDTTNYNVVFANGGDRRKGNTPEYMTFNKNPRVDFAWGVGGSEKKNSSSKILDDWKNSP